MDDSATSDRTLWTFGDQATNEAWELQAASKENEKNDKEESSDDENDAPGNKKPVMHTFYEPTPEWTGMNLEGETKLLEVWKESWENKGWETKVLNRDDAKKHPDFETLEKKLKELSVGAYNRVCYYRWLAMASIDEDSGWMSDYDLFPLNLTAERGRQIEKDDNESFKSFSLHVPCLMHASREYWNRVIHLMMEDLPNDNDGFRLISDMLSLRDVNGSEGMKMSSEVLKHFPYKRNDEGEMQLECAEDELLAVHLSPFECSEAYKQERYPLIDEDIKDGGDAVLRRADAATKLIDDYNDHCLETQA